MNGFCFQQLRLFLILNNYRQFIKQYHCYYKKYININCIVMYLSLLRYKLKLKIKNIYP